MEKDVRRGAGEWRGLHSFKDITLDGDGARSPKRNGGLKMGHDYWYYYELNDGTEIHNTKLPSTTSCPYLPGQPVNVLSVPTQINPVRERSASEGTTSVELQTMNPADKFMAPRAAPAVPRPKLPRLNTAPSVTEWNPVTPIARSASEHGSKSPWSARPLFGLRAALSALPGGQDRGRLASPVARDYGETSATRKIPVIGVSSSAVSSPIDGRSYKPAPGLAAVPGPMSSQEPRIQNPLRREASPLRQISVSESSRTHTALTIPDEITEEENEDDDANFAKSFDIEKALNTRLSPPPAQQPYRLRTESPDIKPLPKLPNELCPTPVAESPSMVPAPLHLAPHFNNIARSHFSVDTILSPELVSPTESQFSSEPSTCDSNDDEDGDAAADDSFNFNFNFGSFVDASLPSRFQYSLPVDDQGSESTLKKGDTGSAAGLDSKVAVRQTFGPHTFQAPEKAGDEAMTALDELLAEMGFLGDMIVRKEN